MHTGFLAHSARIQQSHSCYLSGTLHNFLFSAESMPGMKSDLLWPLSFSSAGGAPSHHPISVSEILPFGTNCWVLTITLAQAWHLTFQTAPQEAEQ